MPWDKVMSKWKAGRLRSGGPGGPVVKNRDQAIAILMSEKSKAQAGNQEYQSKGAAKLAAPMRRRQRRMGRFRWRRSAQKRSLKEN